MAYTRFHLLWLTLVTRPMSVVIPAALIPIGAVTTVLGPDASRAFTLLPQGAQFIAHAMGMFMVVGGLLVLLGISQNETFTELIGLVFAALGCLVYGAGVIIGLGLNGLITGPMFVSIAIASITRVISSTRMAGRVSRVETETMPGPPTG